MKKAAMVVVMIAILAVGAIANRNKASPHQAIDTSTAAIRHVSPDIGSLDKVPKLSVQIQYAIYMQKDIATISTRKLTAADSTANDASMMMQQIGATTPTSTYIGLRAAGGALNGTDQVFGAAPRQAAVRAV